MGCDDYGPLLSRYVDDDLRGEGLDRLLGHLMECVECRMELRELENLCSWFRAADALDAVPEAVEGIRLEHLLEMDQQARKEPSRVRLAGKDDLQEREHAREGKGGERGASWLETLSNGLQAFLFGRRWRYAFPLVAAAILGVWLVPRSPSDWVDVRQLTPLQTLAAQHSPKKEALGNHVDLYVLEHTSNQPWTHYGNELPMIRQVSASMP